MNPHFRNALGVAMSRLKNADVAGATAAIQRALSGHPTRDPHASSEGDRPWSKQGFPRRLGDVLQALKAGRKSYRPPASRDGFVERSDSDPRFTTRTFRNAAGSCTYKLYLPADHGDRELALVLMLHGCTQDPDDFARGTRINSLADERGLVVVYPHQPRSANAQGCWNWFDLRHQQRGSGEPAMLAGLAQELGTEFSINRDRIFVAGLSAGGAMADVLSATYPDVFAAVCVHSGLPYGAANDVMTAFAAMKGNGKSGPVTSGSSVRKIVFHGTADATVHPSNGERVFAAAQSGKGGVQELTSDVMVNGRQVTRSHLALANGAVLAEHWIIQGGTHAWSGGDRSGTYTDATGPDASREMIRFFLEG